jgi:hypothetical protein
MRIAVDRERAAVYFVERLRVLGFTPVEATKLADRFESLYRYYQNGVESVAARALEDRWYESLARGQPDFAIYDDPLYLADALACFFVYSRDYVEKIKAIFGDELASDSILDVGCGIGMTTAALNVLTDGVVVGTQRRGSWQYRFARELALTCDFAVIDDFRALDAIDFVFASEYFEHFERPVDELRAVLKLKPRRLLIANAFGARSTGHFERYYVDSRVVSNKLVGRFFNDELRRRGYEQVRTGFWNNRPAIWRLR